MLSPRVLIEVDDNEICERSDTRARKQRSSTSDPHNLKLKRSQTCLRSLKLDRKPRLAAAESREKRLSSPKENPKRRRKIVYHESPRKKIRKNVE
eukprot:573195-Rhodomonas_salina.2